MYKNVKLPNIFLHTGTCKMKVNKLLINCLIINWENEISNDVKNYLFDNFMSLEIENKVLSSELIPVLLPNIQSIDEINENEKNAGIIYFHALAFGDEPHYFWFDKEGRDLGTYKTLEELHLIF